MNEGRSAFELLWNGDPALFATIELPLAISLAMAVVGMPCACSDPISRADLAGGSDQRLHGPAAGCGRIGHVLAIGLGAVFIGLIILVNAAAWGVGRAAEFRAG